MVDRLGEENTNDESSLHESLADVHDSLQQIKKELETKNTDADVDAALMRLTNAVQLLSTKETIQREEQLAQHPELLNLMREIAHQLQQKNTGAEHLSGVDLHEEKKLLLELMYSILAGAGRKQNESLVHTYSEQARSFYDKIPGIGRLYRYLQQQAG